MVEGLSWVLQLDLLTIRSANAEQRADEHLLRAIHRSVPAGLLLLLGAGAVNCYCRSLSPVVVAIIGVIGANVETTMS